MEDVFVHESSYVSEDATIGPGTRIWHFCHVMAAAIGPGCNFGQGCFVGADVSIGAKVRVQNNVSIYTGTTIEDEVFLGPSCVLTNVTNPRSQVNRKKLYEKTLIRRGATVGANATIVCGSTIGRYAFVAAGAVVTGDVADYALMVGVPARQLGWMSRHGHKLEPDDNGLATCRESGLRYQLRDGQMRGLDLGEEEPLPASLTTGQRAYRDF